MDIEHYANSAMSRAVLHLWRRENYAKCEISMSHGNIQANNVIRFKSLRIATPITLCARITETACNNNNWFMTFVKGLVMIGIMPRSRSALWYLCKFGYYTRIVWLDQTGLDYRVIILMYKTQCPPYGGHLSTHHPQANRSTAVKNTDASLLCPAAPPPTT